MDSGHQSLHKNFDEENSGYLLLGGLPSDVHELTGDDVVHAADIIRWDGVKTFTADHFKVALDTLAAGDQSFRENQKTDEFIEIETGSEDILSQLENVMENGTKLPE